MTASEQQVRESLAALHAYLAGVKNFRYEAEIMQDSIVDSGPRTIQRSYVVRLVVSRPDRMRADIAGDEIDQLVCFDGQTLVVLDRKRNRYVTSAAPGATFGVLLDRLADRFDLHFPLAEIVLRGTAGLFLQPGEVGEYLGLRHVGSSECHHLGFWGSAADRQLWIETGQRPLPRKLLVTWTSEPGWPRFLGIVREWAELPVADAQQFSCVRPAGTCWVEADPLLPS
jgi:hypothetical protein